MLKAFCSGQVFGVRYGTGVPWVLTLPGWQRTHQDFEAVFAPAAGDGSGDTPIDAIVLDLPGFGNTPPPSVVWGTQDYADLVKDVLDECQERVVILGHSFGGRVALQLATALEHRVSALILSGVPLLRLRPISEPSLLYRLVRRLYSSGFLSEQKMEKVRRHYGSADYNAVQGIMRQVLIRVVQESYETRLPSLTCPVELVWGKDDDQTPLELAVKAKELIPHAHLTSCEGVGHLLPIEAPQVLRSVLLRYSDRLTNQ